MKTIFLLFFTLFSFATLTEAASFSFKAPEINGTIHSRSVELTDWQAVMSCHFDVRGVRKESIRYPQTWIKKTSVDTYSLKVKKGSLSEFLPGWRLITCAYKVILIGKNNESKKTVFGELLFIGQEFGEMSETDLNDLQNHEWVAKALNEKMSVINLAIDTDGGIISE